MDQFNFRQLFPNLNDFFIWPIHIQSTTQLSAFFVTILLGIALFFFIYSFFNYLFRFRRRVSWLKKQIKNQNSESIAQNRQELLEQARKSKHDASHLWQEFDETLIEDEQNGTIRLYNTYDAAFFFNASTLAGRITESRLLAAVPSFLTAIGVIGTFVGLQLGLSQLNIANDVTIDEMKSGVAGVINGAKLAFMTSVWGVVLSVVFNLYEKFIAGFARHAITKLQKKIDNLFPRISAEIQLQRIADDGKQSRESLQGLAEKIGDKMQESLLDVTAGIQSGLETSLQKIMAPAIEKLVDETSDGNQKALESLVEKFMEKFGEQGSQQRNAMENASASVNAAIHDMNLAMNAFVNNLKTSQNASGEREKELINAISLQVSQLVEQGNEQKRAFSEFVETQLGNMGNEFNRREEAAQKREQELADILSDQVNSLVENANQQNRNMGEFVENKLTSLTQKFDERNKNHVDRENERNRIFVEQTTAMKTETAQLLERVETGLNTQLSASNQLIQQGQKLQTHVESSVRAGVEAASHMKETATALNTAANSMSLFGNQIREAGDRLSDSVNSAVESTRDLAEQNQHTSKQMENLREQLVNEMNKFNEVITRMQNLITTANTTFNNMNEHQKQYLAGLNRNVEDLATQMTELLEDYAAQANGQTQSHLEIWSSQTTQYASKMNSAVNALSGVVDEIEVKLGR